MRWGVRDEMTNEQLTTEVCMQELAACILNTCLWFVNTDHMNSILASKWSIKITWPEYRSLLPANNSPLVPTLSTSGVRSMDTGPYQHSYPLRSSNWLRLVCTNLAQILNCQAQDQVQALLSILIWGSELYIEMNFKQTKTGVDTQITRPNYLWQLQLH